MRRLTLFALLAILALRLDAAERMSVQQLEQMLAAHLAKDSAKVADDDLLAEITREDDLAPRIAQIELTERLTRVTRERLVTAYKLGPLTQAALDLLGDRSALLDPPPNEIPELPPPDALAQRAMVRAAGAFVFQTLDHLPDFFATRVTTRFDDAPIVIDGAVLSAAADLHLVGTYRREVAYRDGREVLTAIQSDGGRISMWEQGFDTEGEFGPEPAIVVLDLAHGKLAFDHWEKGVAGNVAVFTYMVPEEASHYQVATRCRVTQTFARRPSYHGSLSIDPATGALTRITLQTESLPEDPVSGVASVIEYGPVELGKHSYICPLRSLAFSVEHAMACGTSKARQRKLDRPIVYLNRTQFTTYHRLGSESTIVTAPRVQTGSVLPPSAQENSDLPRR